MFVLDSRNGYLGKEQTEWLGKSLLNSTARWKVILCGHPVAFLMTEEVEEADENETPQGDDAAPAIKGVHMAIEEIGEQEECYSLSAVLAIVAKQTVEETDEGTRDDQAPEDMPSLLNPNRIVIESGIVIFSGGGGISSQPFVATISPKLKLGVPFAAEIHLESMERTLSAPASFEKPKSELNPSVLWHSTPSCEVATDSELFCRVHSEANHELLHVSIVSMRRQLLSDSDINERVCEILPANIVFDCVIGQI